VPDPDEGDDFKEFLNPQSLVVLKGACIEAGVRSDPPGTRYQFERVGYFCSDVIDSKADSLVFNRTVSLRDSWAKVAEPNKPSEGRPQRKTAAAPTPPSPKPRVDRPTELDLIARDLTTMQFFQAAVAAQPDHADAIAKYLVNEVPRELKGRTIDQVPIVPAALADLVALIETGIVSGTAGKEVLARLASEGGNPRTIVEREGLLQINDAGTLQPIIEDVLAQNPDKAMAYRGGRTGLLGFFVGQVMARTGGRANPELVRIELERKLHA
jgi:glutaminyl-tRNA synthetase